MTNYTKAMLSLVVLMLAVSFIVIWNIQGRFTETKEMTIGEAATRIESLYNGKVESFEQKENLFYLALERNENVYDIHIDPKTGNIIKFSRVDKENTVSDSKNVLTNEEIITLLSSQGKGTIHTITLQLNGTTHQYIVDVSENEVLKTLVVNAETGEIISEKVKELTQPTVTAISSEKAKQVALSQLNGKVQYVVFKESSDGGYYLVEIATAQQNAIFEIHAISGKVTSVIRNPHPPSSIQDDDDDNDDDDGNEDDDNDDDDDDD